MNQWNGNVSMKCYVIPFMSLTSIFVVIWRIYIFILLIYAVICQVHESVAQTLTWCRIPATLQKHNAKYKGLGGMQNVKMDFLSCTKRICWTRQYHWCLQYIASNWYLITIKAAYCKYWITLGTALRLWTGLWILNWIF